MFRLPLAAVICSLAAATAEAAFMNSPPTGDNPTPEGWLLVKIPEPQNQVNVVPVGNPFSGEPMFTPGPTTSPNIYANFPDQQFWVSRTDPTFWLRTFDIPGVDSLVTRHNLQAEVDAGLQQVFADPGAIPGTPPGYRFYTYYQDSYTRTVLVPFGNIPEPSGAVLILTACAGLARFSRMRR